MNGILLFKYETILLVLVMMLENILFAVNGQIYLALLNKFNL
jgi:hypothetical protein